ncbi:tetratricopeptide repeat protein [Pediococcus claussenii]|uniref:tetratricopeptide repeat protein n=1 Tax=Pediococcus claussenii TaxID=187452 RepID=UPI00081A4046|nr:tetratricopeptide repeat protein [Pediococcus claussenii]ANZ72227.1 hypothetical protein AYR58_08810 [Pediococcus claussenii]
MNNTTYSEQTLNAIESGDIEEANRLFSWALRKDDDETIYNLAGELFAIGYDTKALRIYQKLMKKYPADSEFKIDSAEILIDQGKNDEAIELLDSVDPDSENYLQALLVAADLYQTEELFEVSESKLLEAYSIAPDEPAIVFALAELYNNMQDYEQATKYYLDLIQRGIPKFAQTNLVERLANSYAAAGKFETAIAYFDQIHEKDLTPNILFQTGLTYLQLKENERAREAFERVIEMDATFASVYPYLVQTYAEDEDWKNALKAAQEGLGVDSYNIDLYLQAATMAEHLQQVDEVEEFLRKGYQTDPENVEILIRLTDFLNRQDNYQNTLKILENVEFTDPQLEWNYAIASWHQDDIHQASESFEAVGDALDDNAVFLKDYFTFLIEQGEVEKAVSKLRKYVLLEPEDIEMQDQLMQYEEQGY